MRPISRKNRIFRCSAYLLAVTILLAAFRGFAETLDESVPAPADGSAIKGTVRVPTNGGSGTNRPSTIGSLFGLTPAQEQEALAGIAEKIKSLNTFTSQGLDNPVVRARFEKFLNAPESNRELVEQYMALFRKVQDSLLRRDVRGATALLYEMANFEWDAQISENLAARVLAAGDMRLTQAELNEKIQKLKKDIETANWNVDIMFQQDSITKPSQNRSASSSSGQTSASNSASSSSASSGADALSSLVGEGVRLTPGKMRAMAEYVKTLEARASLKASELKSGVLEIKNKSDFQDYVSTLFSSRRHLHAILAAGFFRVLFGEGDYPSSMANQVNASKEIVRDVDQSVTVYNFKMENNELAGAWEHLQYAFAASEFHPALLTLSRESKRKVRSFGVNVVKLQNKLEARDFGGVEPLLKDMEAQAADFDATKGRSIVEAVKLQSRLRLGAAKLAAQQGDLKTAMSEFRAAAETWPGNPDLDIAQLGFFNSQDIKSQLQLEFDRLMDAKNYRAIFEKQLQLATALMDDTNRTELMKTALGKVKDVEVALEKANIFRRNNNMFGAWEAVEQAARNWPDDSVLNKMRAELSAESAEFVHQLKQGEEAEEAGELGYSLACYLNARRLYPSSELAKAAIDRLSAKVLKKGT